VIVIVDDKIQYIVSCVNCYNYSTWKLLAWWVHIQYLGVITTYKVRYGLVLRRSYVLEYLVVNRIVAKRALFKWFKLSWVHVLNELVK